MQVKRLWLGAAAVGLVACGDDGGGATDAPMIDAGEVADAWVVDLDASSPRDNDGDGIANADDPTPNGSDANQLKGTFTGGEASVVTITAYDAEGVEDATRAYETDLEVGCADDWFPQGSMCDDPRDAPTDRDSPDVSATIAESGATWYNDDGFTTGVLIIDACSMGGCAAIDFDEARVFQMFSDGKTTAITLYGHVELGATAPAWDDAGWTELASGAVAAGTSLDVDNYLVGDPTVLALDAATVTRYLRVDVVNDGTLGDLDYVELRSLKLFGAPAI